MGQAEIYDILNEHKHEWLNRYDLLKLLPHFSTGRLTTSITRLRKSGFIYKKIVKEKIPDAKTNMLYPVRYYKIIPKNKTAILKGKAESDILVRK